MRRSLSEYVPLLLHWWWLLLVGVFATIIGVGLDVGSSTGWTFVTVPYWVARTIWISALIITLLIAPFLAFHKMRVCLQSATDVRSRELARLILKVRDAAGAVVMLSKIGGVEEQRVEGAYAQYREAMQELTREAELEGIRDTVSEVYSTFVSFHVTRLLGGLGPVIGDPLTVRNIEIDEYRFIGRMASRADDAIRQIKKALQK